MRLRPEHAALTRTLRVQGLSRSDASELAQQWLEHLDDLESAARADGFAPDEAADVALQMLGSTDLLSVAVPHRPQFVLNGDQLACLTRWTGACAGGLLTTIALFSAMTLALAT